MQTIYFYYPYHPVHPNQQYIRADRQNQQDRLITERRQSRQKIQRQYLSSKRHKIIYNNSFGFTDATNTTKLTPQHRFSIGSITKEFSAAALMQLQEKRKLNIEDHVSKYIPELPNWANQVKIKHLLQYTSGIPNVNWKKVKNDQDIFDGLKAIDSLDFKPGTSYDYNNNNIFLRQFIVERLTGMSFKAYAEEFIFKPCGMNSSVMTPLTTDLYIARGFKNDLTPDQPDPLITGGTYLTTTDLLTWENCLRSNKVISRKSLIILGEQFNLPDTQSPLGKAKFRKKQISRTFS